MESIEAKAVVNDEITKAASSRPTNMATVVSTASSVVTGSMSRGTMPRHMPAPQKKACEYLRPRSGECLSHGGGCHSFSPACHGEPSMVLSISRSDTNHQPEPNQWQQSTMMRHSLKMRSSPGLKLTTTSTYLRVHAVHVPHA